MIYLQALIVILSIAFAFIIFYKLIENWFENKFKPFTDKIAFYFVGVGSLLGVFNIFLDKLLNIPDLMHLDFLIRIVITVFLFIIFLFIVLRVKRKAALDS